MPPLMLSYSCGDCNKTTHSRTNVIRPAFSTQMTGSSSNPNLRNTSGAASSGDGWGDWDVVDKSGSGGSG